MLEYRAEGLCRNANHLSREELSRCMASGEVLQSTALAYDTGHRLRFELGGLRGIMPFADCVDAAPGETVKDIAVLTRVGRPTCFVIMGTEFDDNGEEYYLLSRAEAQRRCRAQYLDTLEAGSVIPCTVTHIENFGAFCDIGCGLPALMPIASLSVSRISHPSDRFCTGMDILGVVSSLEGGRVCLSQRELLGTWEENAALFAQGETVAGIVRSVEAYGVFVELTPNLAGLAEPREGVIPGQQAGVYIKSILPEKMKLKLVIIDTSDAAPEHAPLRYFISGGHIGRWVYSPADCGKIIASEFD